MNFLQSLFRKKDEPILNYADFWKWFQQHEKKFHKVVENTVGINERFFDQLSTKLDQINEHIYFVAGMFTKDTAELILAADGHIHNIVFIEELINAAPNIKGWKFTALKPPLAIEDSVIQMDEYRHDKDNVFFYSIEDPRYPDEISLVLTHNEMTDENKKELSSGIAIFLDNLLGELNFVN